MINKKILFIAPLPPPEHGTGIATKVLYSGLKNKFNLELIDISPKKLRKSGKFQFFRFFQTCKNFFQLLFKLVFFKPEIVYVAISISKLGFFKDSFFINLCRIFGKQIVIHVHGGSFGLLYDNSSILMRKLIIRTLKKVDKIIVLSLSLEKMLYFLDEKEKGKIVVIQNCVEDSLIPDEKEIKEKVKNIGEEKEIKVLYLSNFIKEKGYEDVLEAAGILKEEKINFVFAGDWEDLKDKEKTEAFVRKGNLGNVEFVGVVKGKEKRKLILESDIFVFTPRTLEGQPLVILEAMASGLTIITTKQGGISDLIEERKNGFFVREKSGKEIAEKILMIIKNKNLRKKIARNNYEKIKRKYNESEHINKFVDLFNNIAKNEKQ